MHEKDQFQKYFQKHGRYTAGVETRYPASSIILTNEHQHLARGLKIGMRFHSAPVIRAADAKPMQLGHCLKADGRWRLILFAPAGDAGLQTANNLSDYLIELNQNSVQEPSHKPDLDEWLDVRIVFQIHHRELEIESLPSLFLPTKGQFGLIDYEKAFCPDLKDGPDIFESRGIDRQQGALVLVRPDQYVAGIFPPKTFSDVTGDWTRWIFANKFT